MKFHVHGFSNSLRIDFKRKASYRFCGAFLVTFCKYMTSARRPCLTKT